MKVLINYDISNDRERNRIAGICLDFGLERIQYGTFLGELNQKLRQKLVAELSQKLPVKKFNLQIFELDRGSEKKRLIFETKKE